MFTQLHTEEDREAESIAKKSFSSFSRIVRTPQRIEHRNPHDLTEKFISFFAASSSSVLLLDF
jgi:hypothetical protein